jgi:hypothetical protein
MRYTSRDVQSNIQNLIEDVKALTHIWQPGSEADPGMILLKALAAEVDLLSFNLDNQTDEMYMQSATQIKSIRRLGVANGYTPGWYRAPRTMLTLENMGTDEIELNFDLESQANNICYADTNALEDLTSIPYFIIPSSEIATDYDKVIIKGKKLNPDTEKLEPTYTARGTRADIRTRMAVQGTMKSIIINPDMLIERNTTVNSLTYKLPSQNIDGDLIWVQELNSTLDIQTDIKWLRDKGTDFVENKKPLYQISVDDYNNLVIVFNKCINDTHTASNLIRIYYIETYGAAGEVAENVIRIKTISSGDAKNLQITHPGNTLDMADGSALTGLTPLTAHDAYLESRNWVNTNDSIITLKNFTAWIRRQPGISNGISVDCQKALEINWAYRYDEDMDDSLKPLKYLYPGTLMDGSDFPYATDANGKQYDPIAESDLDFPHQFKTNSLLWYCVFNNFLEKWNTGYINANGTQCMFDGATEWEGDTSEWSTDMVDKGHPYRRYRPSAEIRSMIQAKYKETYNLTAKVDFGWLRVFEWSVNGIIWTKEPVTQGEADSIVETVIRALRVRFHASNVEIGELPRQMDIVECVTNADSRIRYFDAGLLNKPMINWGPVRDGRGNVTDSSITYDIRYFNAISFARFLDGDTEYYYNAKTKTYNVQSQISVAKECIIKDSM